MFTLSGLILEVEENLFWDFCSPFNISFLSFSARQIIFKKRVDRLRAVLGQDFSGQAFISRRLEPVTAAPPENPNPSRHPQPAPEPVAATARHPLRTPLPPPPALKPTAAATRVVARAASTELAAAKPDLPLPPTCRIPPKFQVAAGFFKPIGFISYILDSFFSRSGSDYFLRFSYLANGQFYVRFYEQFSSFSRRQRTFVR